MLRGAFVAGIVLASHVASADPCAPTVAIDGTDDVAQPLRELLVARGIATTPEPGCPTVHARIERRGEQLVVAIERRLGEQPIEHAVGELDTAATVIESWTRTDVVSPLLATHPIPIEPAPPAPTTIVITQTPPRRGVDLFAAVESSYASDETTWMGAHLGACVVLGPICAAARLRFSSVVAGPAMWRGLERRNVEVLLGLDVPLRLGWIAVTPGFGAGIGSMHTRIAAAMDEGNETGGLRADAHVTASWPLAHQFALDLSVTGDLTQATRVESRSAIALPDEPRALIRLSAGIRYGGL